MTPLKKFVSDAGESRCGAVGCGGERVGNLFISDGGKGSGREGGGVVWVGIWDGGRNRREESFHQNGMDLCCGGTKFSRCFQEGGNVVHAASVAPASGRPETFDGGVVKEVHGPSPLRFSNGLA